MSFNIDDVTLLKCLARAECIPNHSKINLKSQELQGGVALPGTNHTSEVFRLNVHYELEGELKTRKFILKVPYLSDHYAIMTKLGRYEHETYFYEKIHPKITNLLGFSISPTHYYTTNLHCLILEDLSIYGYQVEPSFLFNLEQSRAALKTLAQFHAASAKLYYQDPYIFSKLSNGILFVKNNIDTIVYIVLPNLLKILQKEGIASATINKFKDCSHEILSANSLFNLRDRSTGFSVLNHNDMKCNNFLFKYCNGKPISTKIIDYQTSCWGSPVFDLIFFCIQSMSFSVFEQHFEELLNSYLDSLNTTLKELDCEEEYTKLHFQTDEVKARLFRLFCLMWAGCQAIQRAVETFDHDKNPQPLNEEAMEKVIVHEKFRNGFLKWFLHFEKLDLF